MRFTLFTPPFFSPWMSPSAGFISRGWEAGGYIWRGWVCNAHTCRKIEVPGDPGWILLPLSSQGTIFFTANRSDIGKVEAGSGIHFTITDGVDTIVVFVAIFANSPPPGGRFFIWVCCPSICTGTSTLFYLFFIFCFILLFFSKIKILFDFAKHHQELGEGFKNQEVVQGWGNGFPCPAGLLGFSLDFLTTWHRWDR